MKKCNDMIFWGEILPKTQTGISVSNSIIISILREAGKNITQTEECSWNKGVVSKILHYIGTWFKLLGKCVKGKYHIFYFNIPLSEPGLVKLIGILLMVRLLRPSMQFTGHLHRGDLAVFQNSSVFGIFLLKIAFSCIDRIIVCSPSFGEQLAQCGYRKEITVLRNTSSLEGMKADFTRVYAKRFAFITNYIEAKGVLDLFQCFTEHAMRSFNLETFGNIYEKDTFRKMEQMKTANIVINGPLRRTVFAETLNGFDALVLPSWNEGQPFVVLEAMSLGLPVIASDVGDVRNMLGEDYPLFFEPGDVESLKSAILRFDKYENKAGLAMSVLKQYQRLFSNEIYKTQVLNIFNSLSI